METPVSADKMATISKVVIAEGRMSADKIATIPEVVIAEGRMSADKMESICLVQAAAAITATTVITAVITAIIIATTEVAQASATILVQTAWGFRGEIR